MAALAEVVANGVITGSLYVLVAAGLTLIFGVLNVPQFAHGQLVMLAAYSTYFLVAVAHLPFLLCLGIAAAMMFGLGIVIEASVFRRLRGAPALSGMIAAFALYALFENVATALWGADYSRFVPFPISARWDLFGVYLTADRVAAFVVSLLALGLLTIIVQRTPIGLQIRAVAQNPDAAAVLGISVNRIHVLTFAIGSALAGLAGALLATLYPITPEMGADPTLKAFVVIVLGGLGSIPGAVLGGLLLGVVENLGVAYVSSSYSETFAFAVMIVALLIRPSGLLGRRT